MPWMKGFFLGFRWVQPTTISISTYREITVARAAPLAPIAGAPKWPKIRI